MFKLFAEVSTSWITEENENNNNDPSIDLWGAPPSILFCEEHYPFKAFKKSVIVSNVGRWQNVLYNFGQICRLSHVLAEFLFATSETELDYYYQKMNVRVTTWLAEQHKTLKSQEIRKF